MTTVNATGAAARASQARRRSAIYANLAALFADAPGADALASLIDAASDADARAGESERALYAYLSGLGGREPEALRREVASEYAELFIGPRPPLAPYYESVYLGNPRRLFTEQTMSVRRFYERCGLAVVKDGKVPDDQLSYELELMATLAAREAGAAEAGDAAGADAMLLLQREFLAVHLGGWAAPFAERVAAAPCAGFYRALAEFVRDFVAEDDAYLAETALENDRTAAVL